MKALRILLLGLALIWASNGFAQSFNQDALIASLQTQGFEIKKISRSYLGRIIIEAESKKFEREIVIDPNSGEILRDYWESHDDDHSDDDDDNGGWFTFLFRFGRSD